MASNEKPSQKLYYSIGEVAQMFGLNTSHIRFWEKEFDIIKPKKNKKGNRLFTKEDIDNLRLIHHLVKEQGYTLEGAKKKIKDDRKAVEDNMELIRSLQNVKSFLLDLKDQL